jgi:hypothetical protein
LQLSHCGIAQTGFTLHDKKVRSRGFLKLQLTRLGKNVKPVSFVLHRKINPIKKQMRRAIVPRKVPAHSVRQLPVMVVALQPMRVFASVKPAEQELRS